MDEQVVKKCTDHISFPSGHSLRSAPTIHIYEDSEQKTYINNGADVKSISSETRNDDHGNTYVSPNICSQQNLIAVNEDFGISEKKSFEQLATSSQNIIVGNVAAKDLVSMILKSSQEDCGSECRVLTDTNSHMCFQTVQSNLNQISSCSSLGNPEGNIFSAVLKPELNSSDTLIIDPGQLLVGQNTGLTQNVLLSASDNNITRNVVSKDGSAMFSDTIFNLVSGLSDRSISLESIPSLSVFDPWPSGKKDDISTNTNLSSSYSSQGSGHKEGGFHLLPGRLAVLGNAVPQSILCLLRKTLLPTGTDSSDSVIPPKVPSGCLLNRKEDPYSQEKEDEKILHTTYNSTTKVVDIQDEADTDMSECNEEVSEVYSLSREDTLILDSKASETRSVCTNKDYDMENKGNGERPIDSNDCKNNLANSTNNEQLTSKQSVFDSANHPSNVRTIDPNIIVCSSLFQAGQLNTGSGIYLDLTNGCTPMIRCLSGELLDISGLLQKRVSNTLSLEQESVSREHAVNVKEVQTDIVFGNGHVNIDSSQLCMVQNEQMLSVPSTLSNFTGPPSSVNIPISVTNITGLTQQTSHRSADTALAQPNSDPLVIDNGDSSFHNTGFEKKFTNKKGLKRQDKLHKESFKCDLCNTTFTRQGNFTRHRKIHNLHAESHALYKCEDCGREFLQRCDLTRHLLIHAKKEPHRCGQCGKGYIRRSDLVVHMRFHNREKAFKCDQCGKEYYQSGDLSRHQRRSHKPNSELTCGHCDRKYACEATLIRHMKATHKDIIFKTVSEKMQLGT